MCITFIYRNPKADGNAYRIILAFNRDEALNRPTASAHWWKNYPECLGGIDLESGKEGGTWLAFCRGGRCGALLNLTGEKRSSKTPGKGRGHLVSDYIISNVSADEYLTKLHEENHIEQAYNPYNLILINLWNADVSVLCSAQDSSGLQKCSDDILGLGNSAIDQPFTKVRNGKKKFRNIIRGMTTGEQDKMIENLLEFLTWDEKHLPDPELQRRAPNWYEDLSSIFVRVPNVEYGTRTHSILLVDGLNNVTFVEKTLTLNNSWTCQTFKTKLQTVA
ncbi:transport and Golgi organization protein 2 [Athalia rosae]|uniref:transport and Golgi organization protein 2 n=1 Tax=Athalia rosae TaxID=37344 RepID=UPI0020332335|nr:transport and Golgi organization protein 2 [Athalia rosae]